MVRRGARRHFTLATPGMVKAYEGLAGWMDAKWREQVDDMEALCLFTHDERPEFASTC